MHIGFFACFHGISRTQSFQENRPFIFQACVVLKPLVSLMGRLVACSARISVDTHTDRQQTTTVTLAAHARRGLINWAEAHSSYTTATMSLEGIIAERFVVGPTGFQVHLMCIG